MRKSSRIGCLSNSGIFAGVVTLLLVFGVTAARGGVLYSPGDLNAEASKQPIGGVISHADTGGRCAACHPPFWSSEKMADRCLACHTEVLDGGDFHDVMLAQSKSLSCYGCHTDHRGPQAALTVLNLDRFPHGEVGFSLRTHQTLASGAAMVCQDCHAEGFSEFDQLKCWFCHQELAPETMGSHRVAFGIACLGCHDGLDTYGAAFDHAETEYPLEGKHSEAACGFCHLGVTSPEELRATPQDCFSCHVEEDAHRGELGQDCARCHTPVNWESVTFNHDETEFPLTGAHRGGACIACHAEGVFDGTPQDCYACHAQEDAHAGRFGQDCAACHVTDNWERVEFDHALTNFPLTGAHIAVECEDCHGGGVYAGTPPACYACHEQDDAHAGEFGQECSACHTTENWEEASFDHSRSAFPLTGKHIGVACADCHAGNVFAGTPLACEACHADPAYHVGLFGTDCVACHTSGGWRPATFNQAHRFPINHGESGWSACTVCHPTQLQTYTCYGCHEHTQDKIAAEHREEGIRDFENCVRCHPTGHEEEGGEGGEGGDD